MKIADIRTHVLEAELDQPFSYSRAWYAKRASLIVEVVTDTGIVGWGESYGPAAINAAVIKHFRPFLIGQDPMRTEWIWKELYASYRDHGQKGSVIQGLSGVDIALWDIKGKFLNQPIHALLGGWQRKSVAAYATGLYRRESGDPVDYLAEEAMGYCAEGFGAVKLKVGFGIEADRKAVEAVRQADELFGPFAAVVGHSFGGAVATSAVAGSVKSIAPLRTGRLVLVAAPCVISAVFEKFSDMLNVGPRSRAAMSRKVERISGRALDEFCGDRQLAATLTPTLVIHAHDDREVPSWHAERYAAAGGHVRLCWADGLGHRRILADQEVVRRAVGFAADPQSAPQG